MGRAPIIFLDAIWQSSIHVSWPHSLLIIGERHHECVSLYLWTQLNRVLSNLQKLSSKGPFVPPATFLRPPSPHPFKKKEASPCHVLTSTSQMFSICKMDISAFLCYLLNSFTFHSDLNHTVGKLG